MYELRKSFTFEASHVLPRHDGKCARLHGHSWRAVVVVRGRRLFSGLGVDKQAIAQTGMLCDYAKISEAVKPLIDGYLDHYHLNDSLSLDDPTSEAVAQWLYRRLLVELKLPVGVYLAEVQVDETCTSSCRYWEE
jgi:6-pyruvoyltetrahydropterin/6-carboxytetrahydropterin synthase